MSLPMAAQASEEGKRNTALGLGAAALTLLLTQNNKAPGLIAAAGAAVAASQLGHGDRSRHDYDAGWNSRYDRYGANDGGNYCDRAPVTDLNARFKEYNAVRQYGGEGNRWDNGGHQTVRQVPASYHFGINLEERDCDSTGGRRTANRHR